MIAQRKILTLNVKVARLGRSPRWPAKHVERFESLAVKCHGKRRRSRSLLRRKAKPVRRVRGVLIDRERNAERRAARSASRGRTCSSAGRPSTSRLRRRLSKKPAPTLPSMPATASAQTTSSRTSAFRGVFSTSVSGKSAASPSTKTFLMYVSPKCAVNLKRPTTQSFRSDATAASTTPTTSSGCSRNASAHQCVNTGGNNRRFP